MSVRERGRERERERGREGGREEGKRRGEGGECVTVLNNYSLPEIKGHRSTDL